jgi:hypothetical protein
VNQWNIPAAAAARPSGHHRVACAGDGPGTAATRAGGHPLRARRLQVTVTNGRIIDVEAVEYPTASARHRSINARAMGRARSTMSA